MTTHCQICGREIKANTGLIAHHGYTRPHYGSGYQTASCYGARHVPYEVGHDALDKIIPLVERDIAYFADTLANWVANPPAKISYRRQDGWGNLRGEEVVLDRPTDFDPNVEHDYSAYRPGTYANRYWGTRREIEMSLKGSRYDLEIFRKRLAEWKAI